jgi:hypothetical protein
MVIWAKTHLAWNPRGKQFHPFLQGLFNQLEKGIDDLG